MPFPPDYRSQADALLQRVVDIRNSPAKTDVQMFLIPRASAIKFYAPKADADTRRLNGVQQDVYTMLGLVPQGVDVAQQGVAYLGTQITGFYDADLKAFYLLNDQGSPTAPAVRSTIVHEFTHALEDQYYDLNAIGKQREASWDATRAFFSTIEGDALNTETVFFGRPLRNQNACFTLPPDRGGATPYVLQRDLNSWYDDGLCFVQAVLPQLPDGFASLFARLPATTEQLLHPDKYLAGEGAKKVEAPALLSTPAGGGWSEQGHGDFGEYTLQNLLAMGLSRDLPRAQRAADGWGGDAWRLYARGDTDRLLTSTVAWDTLDDASDFFASLRDALTNRGAAIQPQPGDTCLRATAGPWTWRATLRGDSVILVVGNDAASVDGAAQGFASGASEAC